MRMGCRLRQVTWCSLRLSRSKSARCLIGAVPPCLTKENNHTVGLRWRHADPQKALLAGCRDVVSAKQQQLQFQIFPSDIGFSAIGCSHFSLLPSVNWGAYRILCWAPLPSTISTSIIYLCSRNSRCLRQNSSLAGLKLARIVVRSLNSQRIAQ